MGEVAESRGRGSQGRWGKTEGEGAKGWGKEQSDGGKNKRRRGEGAERERLKKVTEARWPWERDDGERLLRGESRRRDRTRSLYLF